jgi:hypothetical protein
MKIETPVPPSSFGDLAFSMGIGWRPKIDGPGSV